MRITVTIFVEELTMCQVVWNGKIKMDFTRIINSTRSLWWTFKSAKIKYISRWVDWENHIYVRWNSIEKQSKKAKMVINRGKWSKTPNKVKPVQNTNKNPPSFLKITPVEKEVSPSHNCKTKHMNKRILSV